MPEVCKNALCKTLLGKFARAIAHANEKEKAILALLANAYVYGLGSDMEDDPPRSGRFAPDIAEATFAIGVRAAGMQGLWDPDHDIEYIAEDLVAFAKIVRREDWLSDCMHGLMVRYEAKALNSLEDVLAYVDGETGRPVEQD
ncbi:MAG TPA: hypothetical protein VME43_30050 [Bryobacteraceae bacterium]|nr:hypothetical protein [Bryobacteraceae bacterium]